MIAVDTNLLVYAHRDESVWHAAALKALDELDARKKRWAIPWPCVFEFYNIVTHPRIFKRPTPPQVALEAVSAWQESSWLEFLSEGKDCWPDFQAGLESRDIKGPKVHDARIMLICRYHGVEELWSADRDFSRMNFIKVTNPLTQSQPGG